MRYLKQILYKNRWMAFFYAAMGIFNSFLASYRASYFQKVIDGLADGGLTLGMLAFYGAVLVIGCSMNYVEIYPQKKLEHSLFLDFKILALEKIGSMDFQEYQKIGSGVLVQRIESGAAAGRNILHGFWLCLVRELLPTVAFSLFFIWSINRKAAYVILGGYGVVFLITNLLLKGLYQIKEKILNHEELLNHYLVRGFMEMVVFRTQRQFPNELRKARRAKGEIVGSKVKMSMIHEAFFTLFALLIAALNIAVLFYGWRYHGLTVGEAAALLSLIENAYLPVAIFNVIYVQYKLDKTAFSRLEELLQAEEDKRLYTGLTPDALLGDIHIRDMSFSYNGTAIFDKLNLTIEKGEKVALVGESGSGKSTLVKLLAGLLKYEAGQIEISGTELKDLCLDAFYERVAYLSQDAPVFDGSVRENLAFDRDIPESELMEALENVQLTGLIRRMDDGLETRTGEKGAMLSGGERQRLALARIGLQRPQLILLDEAASALDQLTEEKVMGEMLKRWKNQTVISVVHRLHSIREFDRIVVFRRGKIVGEGTFEALLEGNAYFRELYQAGIGE